MQHRANGPAGRSRRCAAAGPTIDQPTAIITVRAFDKLGRPINIGPKAAALYATELKLAQW
jgi:hypothetical protein